MISTCDTKWVTLHKPRSEYVQILRNTWKNGQLKTDVLVDMIPDNEHFMENFAKKVAKTENIFFIPEGQNVLVLSPEKKYCFTFEVASGKAPKIVIIESNIQDCVLRARIQGSALPIITGQTIFFSSPRPTSFA